MNYDLVRREVTSTDGKIRLRATLIEGGLLELFEYVVEKRGQLSPEKYRFHWQDAGGRLIKRWDNVRHYPHLSNAPHHVHKADDSVQPAPNIPDVLAVVAEIEEGTQ